MPRNKIVKRAKKRPTNNNVLVNVKKMEMDLMQIPSKLVAQINKEVDVHKRKKNKLTKAVNKSSALLTKAETRLESAMKTKTPAAKKLLKKAKNIYKTITKTHGELNNQLQHTSNTLNLLSDKQEKLISLDRYLNQFEKEWLKSARKAKTKIKKTYTKTKSVAPDFNVAEVESGQSLENRLEEAVEIPS